jgi:hypothetical protein
MNATTQAIKDRLPQKPVLSPGDIAAAYGMPDATPILEAIRRGRILAATVGRKFYVSRDEAARYIETTAYQADEA